MTFQICKKLKFSSRESKLLMMPKSKHFSKNTTLTEMDFLIVKVSDRLKYRFIVRQTDNLWTVRVNLFF